MSESALERLRTKVRKKDVERKVETFRREQIEKKIVEHVRLIGAIYVELLTSCTPTVEEIKFFEQK